MHSSSIIITALFSLISISLTAGNPSVLINPAIYNNNPVPESRNVFQQFVINQIVNVLPQNVRDGINDAAAIFSMTRAEFLVRILKELQAFQAYSKIDFITAIQKIVKFADDKLTRQQQSELEQLETQGIQLASLIFENKLNPGELNPVYDLVVKIVRQQMDGDTLVIELPRVIEEILSHHF